MFLTFPYGHNGAYPTLGIVKHHLNPLQMYRIGSQVANLQKLNGWKKLICCFFGRKGTKTSFRIDINPVNIDENEINDW